jgi:hypothetical protein
LVDDRLPLVRDVLDKQVLDVDTCKIGKVDGIIVALRAHRAPRVIAIELGQATAWRRVHQKLGDLVEWIQRRFEPGRLGPVRILFEHVVGSGIDVHIDVDGRQTHAFVWEDWLEEHVSAKIPGGRRGGKK